MDYGDFKDLNRRTAADKVLPNKAFDIVKYPKYDGYQRGFASMIYRFFWWKNCWWSRTLAHKSAIKTENVFNKELGEELHKPIIRKFKERKVHSPFIDNISGTDVADIQLIRKFNKGFRSLLCVIDFYSNYACVIPLKAKKELQLLMLFKKF